MVAVYDPNLRVTEQGTNDNPNTWGSVINQQVIALLCSAIAGVTQVDFSGGVDIDISTSSLIPPHNLPGVATGAADTARNMVLELTSSITPLTGPLNLIIPSVQKVYIIRGAQTGGNINVKCTGGTASVVIAPGSITIVYTNGTNLYSISAAGLLASSNNLSDVANAATARTNLGLGSAALLTAGTSPNNAVKLDVNGKLPALDGSQLTNVVGTPAGIGTAAFLNVGTAAGNVVQLNGSAQLPALDGSQLLNLPIPTSITKAAAVFVPGSSITTSVNIASITKVSTGVYTVVMTTPLADTNYIVMPTCAGPSAGSIPGTPITENSTFARTTTSFQLNAFRPNIGFIDPASVSFIVIHF